MSETTSSEELMKMHLVGGIPFPDLFPADVVQSAIDYKPRPDDVFLVTYPKCGTTWCSQILVLLFRQGRQTDSFDEFQRAVPFLEITGAKAAETMPRPGAVKIHFPYNITPKSNKAKYIYLARNPKDCCVSYYHHCLNMPGNRFSGTFDQFFELFHSGSIWYGDYYDHLLGWYQHKDDPNVLFLTYEQLKENPEENIMKIAEFIDSESLAEPMRKDPQILQNVVHYSSFKHMKEYFNANMDSAFNRSPEDIEKSDLPEAVKKLILSSKEKESNPSSINFVRKGIIGDWRNYLSEDQNRRMDAKFSEKTKGTGIPDLWKEYM